jgi:hypothetical protein
MDHTTYINSTLKLNSPPDHFSEIEKEMFTQLKEIRKNYEITQNQIVDLKNNLLILEGEMNICIKCLIKYKSNTETTSEVE